MTTINLTIRFETFVNNLSFSRSVAQPRNAVGEAPPHEQPHVCPVPLCLSILSKLCSLVPWLSRGMQWVWLRLTSSRMFAPFLCACRFWASCVSCEGAS